MTLIRHELRRGRMSLLIWTAAVGFLLTVCVFLFPEMRGEMGEVGDLFASMGSFTAAFGMDRLDFGAFSGYYAVECGNILGLGGALFAAMTAASALAKEEGEGTAEFLLTHPVSRAQVVTGKLAALLVQVAFLNLAVFLLAVASTAAIGEAVPWRELGLLHLAHLLLQLELTGVCLGLSALLGRGSQGAGLGVAAGAYFLNLIANISEGARWLRWITPFAYTEGADIFADMALDGPLAAVGLAYAVAGAAFACLWYSRKDIR